MTQVTDIDETVTIGGDLTVGRIGYGAMQLTGPKVWGEYPDHDQGIALLREFVAAGVTFIDTADAYGPHSNEELIREALHPYPEQLVIATKGRVRAQRPRVHRHGRRREPALPPPRGDHERAPARPGPHRPLLPAHADDDRRSVRGDRRNARGAKPGRPPPPPP